MEQNKNPNDNGENRDKRNDKGQFLPGTVPNPNGRPKGSMSITAEIKKKLLEVPDPTNNKKTHLEFLVEQVIRKAIKEGDGRMIKQIWNYVDGLPVAKLKLEDDRDDEQDYDLKDTIKRQERALKILKEKYNGKKPKIVRK